MPQSDEFQTRGKWGARESPSCQGIPGRVKVKGLWPLRAVLAQQTLLGKSGNPSSMQNTVSEKLHHDSQRLLKDKSLLS